MVQNIRIDERIPVNMIQPKLRATNGESFQTFGPNLTTEYTIPTSMISHGTKQTTCAMELRMTTPKRKSNAKLAQLSECGLCQLTD